MFDNLVLDPIMFGSIVTVIVNAIAAYLVVLCRKRPFSEPFELNAIYHYPPSNSDTLIQPFEDMELTVAEIQRTMLLAVIYARPDYELAKDPEKYKRILQTG